AAGVVDEDVGAAECGAGGGNRIQDLRFLADVALDRQGPAAGLLHLFGHRVDGAGELGVGHAGLGDDGDVGAVARGAQGDGAADAARGAGDEEGLACKGRHPVLLLRPGARGCDQGFGPWPSLSSHFRIRRVTNRYTGLPVRNHRSRTQEWRLSTRLSTGVRCSRQYMRLCLSRWRRSSRAKSRIQRERGLPTTASWKSMMPGRPSSSTSQLASLARSLWATPRRCSSCSLRRAARKYARSPRGGRWYIAAPSM